MHSYDIISAFSRMQIFRNLPPPIYYYLRRDSALTLKIFSYIYIYYYINGPYRVEDMVEFFELKKNKNNPEKTTSITLWTPADRHYNIVTQSQAPNRIVPDVMRIATLWWYQSCKIIDFNYTFRYRFTNLCLFKTLRTISNNGIGICFNLLNSTITNNFSPLVNVWLDFILIILN